MENSVLRAPENIPTSPHIEVLLQPDHSNANVAPELVTTLQAAAPKTPLNVLESDLQETIPTQNLVENTVVLFEPRADFLTVSGNQSNEQLEQLAATLINQQQDAAA